MLMPENFIGLVDHELKQVTKDLSTKVKIKFHTSTKTFDRRQHEDVQKAENINKLYKFDNSRPVTIKSN
jgi:hypothetical protein